MGSGMGFAVRDGTQHDVEDDVDVDGEDEAVYGVAQFTEGDILRASTDPDGADEDEAVDTDTEDDLQSPGASGSGTHNTNTNTDASPRPKQPKTVPDPTADGHLLKRAGSEQAAEEPLSAGEMAELDRAIDLAQKAGNTHALVTALRNKLSMLVSPSLSSVSLRRQRTHLHLHPDLDNERPHKRHGDADRSGLRRRRGRRFGGRRRRWCGRNGWRRRRRR